MNRMQEVVGKAMHHKTLKVHAVVERKPVKPWTGDYPVRLLCGHHLDEHTVVSDEMDPLVRLAVVNCMPCLRHLDKRITSTHRTRDEQFFERVADDELESWSYLLAINVRRLRHTRGMTQDDLATRAGLGQTQISAIEGGDNNPQLETLARVAAGLSCGIDDLFRRDSEDIDTP